MKIHVRETGTNRTQTIDVEATTTVDVIRLKISSAFGVSYDLLRIYMNDRPLDNPKETAGSLKLQPNSLIEFTTKKTTWNSMQDNQINRQAAHADSLREEAMRLMNSTRQSEALLYSLSQSDPKLYEAVASKNINRVIEILAQRRAPSTSDSLIDPKGSLNESRGSIIDPKGSLIDPRGSLHLSDMDSSFQLKIENKINQDRLDQIAEDTYEHYPELFVPTEMLFFTGKINGVETEIFVDTGAQTTIISKSFAQRSNILKNVDRRYAATVMGVGIQQSLGRIWQIPLEINGKFFVLAATILENFGHDVLLGLDMMKRHGCLIDLRGHCMTLGQDNYKVPFLTDHQLSIINQKKAHYQIKQISESLGVNEGKALELFERTGQDVEKAIQVGLQLKLAGRL